MSLVKLIHILGYLKTWPLACWWQVWQTKKEMCIIYIRGKSIKFETPRGRFLIDGPRFCVVLNQCQWWKAGVGGAASRWLMCLLSCWIFVCLTKASLQILVQF